MNRKTTIKFLLASLFLGGLFLGTLAFIPEVRALDTGVNVVEEAIDLTGTDIRVIIARIIRMALGLLGVIALGLVLYGGFVWMTAGGEEDKVSTAKKILTNAAIGLVIILTSFAITQFVLNKLVEATTGVSVVRDEGGGGGSLSSRDFAVRGITPQNPAPPRGFPKNAVVRIRMSQAVDSATVPGNVTVKTAGGASAAGDISVQGSLIRFAPTGSCGDDPGNNCFAADTTFVVEVASGLRSSGGRFVTCGGLAPDCRVEFTTGNYIDVADPVAIMVAPDNTQSVPSNFETVRALAMDDAGLAEVEFFNGSISIDVDLPPPGARDFAADALWETNELPLQSCQPVKATAMDLAENKIGSETVTAVIRPAHCFNGTQDAGETGLDCGGDPTSLEYCGKCAGEACGATPADACALFCRSGSCVSGFCVDLPRIDSISPSAAGPGSFVTISGEFFGGAPGTVTFLGGDGSDDDVVAALAPCATAWSPTQIIVVVPDNDALAAGPIKVGTAIGGATSDTIFTPTDVPGPGICGIDPDEGGAGAGFRITGIGFGVAQGGSNVLFDVNEVTAISSWTEDSIRGNVPTMAARPVDVRAKISGQLSNPVDFTVIGPEAGEEPVITSISPNRGSAGTYITIFGTGFGRIGQVIFTNPVTGATAIGDTSFPEGCSVDFWQNNQITVKVPATYSSGAEGNLELRSHDVMVRRSGVSEATSNREEFTVNNNPAPPGLCGLSPVSGPEGTLVHLFGERLGDLGTTTVKFYSDLTSAATFVSSGEARANVPDRAESGPVVVRVAAAGESNPRNFRVADCRTTPNVCEVGFECCGNGACAEEGACGEHISDGGYAWYFSTGPIPRVPRLIYACGDGTTPSPSPFSLRSGGEQVCVNAVVTGRFSIPMEPSTINGGNVALYLCAEDENNEISCDSPVSGVVSSFEWEDGSGSGHGFRLIPAALLTNTWYEVRLATAIRGNTASGAMNLIEDPECGPGMAYCWRFKTKNNDTRCTLGSIQIEPNNKVAEELGQNIPYMALPRAAGDLCLMIRPDYDFAWSATDPDGRASVVRNEDSQDLANATTIAETPIGNPVDIKARVASEGVEGIGLLTIDFVDPRVVEFAPNCDQACINTGLKIRFNTRMKDSGSGSVLNPGAVEMWKCRNESCLVSAANITLADPRLNNEEERGIPAGRILRVDPQGNLEPQTFYRVIINGGASGVKSSSGVALAGANYGQDFSWVFRTKNDPTECSIVSVQMVPEEAVVSVIGDRALFSAIPLGSPDECSAEGQELVGRDYGWSWEVKNPSTGYVWFNWRGGVDTTTSLPTGCSSQCLLTGARGVAGAAAVCGDGRVDYALGEECDDGGIIDGNGCSSNCTQEGSVDGRICGNGGPCLVDGDCDRPSEVCNPNNLTCVERSPSSGGEDCDDGKQCSNGVTCTSAADCVGIGDGTCQARNGDGCSEYCQNEGSSAGGSTCGNGSVGVGEDCDDGNRTSDDGCSSECLAEGSYPEPFALCGDRVPQRSLGEECDGGAGCDPITCLRTGAIVTCTSPTGENCCGNRRIENWNAEDCDDGNLEDGDGCSARCLAEGADPMGWLPSFCGDGWRRYAGGTQAEECEASGGDGRVDPTQLVVASGMGTVVNGEQTTEVYATANGVRGVANFILACGFQYDSQCSPTMGGSSGRYGVGANSCCYPRPLVLSQTPGVDYGANAEEDGDPPGACRNPLIRVDFDRKMDLASFTGNVLVAKGVADEGCPEGQSQLLAIEDSASTDISILPTGVAGLWQRAKGFFGSFIGSAAAHAPPAVPSRQPGGAGAWCLGGVAGTAYGVDNPGDPNNPADDTSSLFFQLSRALDPMSWYRVRIVGDDLDATTINGVRSVDGVGMLSNYEWSFHTGTKICLAETVQITDGAATPGLFTSSGESHTFAATAYSRGADASPIVPVPGVYDWTWRNWASSNNAIVSVPSHADGQVNPNTATVTADGLNGTARVSTQLQVTTDTLSPAGASTAGDIVPGALTATVFLCENPGLKVEDAFGNVSGLGEPFGNFRTQYCRDDGETGTHDDLPQMYIQSVGAPAAGILKDFALRYEDSGRWGGDAIGFRMMANPNHYSAARWYVAQGFIGAPEALTVDGYDAVRDGRTVYIHAANLGSDGKLYSNIYVISYNDGATPETRTIYDQLIANLVFNVNLPDTENTNICLTDSDEIISCTTDLDCPADGVCASQKDKIRRDTRRLVDFRDMENALAVYRCRERGASGCTGSYPTLQGGTFVRSMSVSAWPSWLDTLSSELGAALPADPVNRFEDCPDANPAGGLAAYDDATCYAATAAAGCPFGECYQCPAGSQVYEYTSLGPNGYRLETDLEYRDHEWEHELIPLSSSVGAELVVNRVAPFMCHGSVIGASTDCGDGVLGGLEACELGETSFEVCMTGSGRPGQRVTNCNATCSGFAAAAGAECRAEYCGDGVVSVDEYGRREICDDGSNNGRYGFCAHDCGVSTPLSPYAAYCGDMVMAGVEQCDLGDNNGQWTRDADDSCAWDCSFPGPYCGDEVTQVGHEVCDSNVETGKGLCFGDLSLRPCNSDGECGPGGQCVLTAPVVCEDTLRCSGNINITCDTAGAICAAGNGICTRYETERRRTCDMTGADMCTWDTSAVCEPIGFCGDGETQAGEECDDGDDDNNNACTNDCSNNVCGDGFPWTGVEQCDFGGENGVPCAAPYGTTCNYCSSSCIYVTQTGAFCGDGSVSPSETCDGSASPILDEATAPLGYGAENSICSMACDQVCPPQYSSTQIRFVGPPRATEHVFPNTDATEKLSIPESRMGGGLLVDASFGADVIHFPSPMDVLFVIDNSGSMRERDMECVSGNAGLEMRKTCVRRALCGNSFCGSFTQDSAIRQLLESRDPGDVRIGVIEYGTKSRYRTWQWGNFAPGSSGGESTACSASDSVPCYDHTAYLAGTNPSNADGTGFIPDDINRDDEGYNPSSGNREKIRSILADMGSGSGNTRAWLALRQAKEIMASSDAASKVVIFMSDGVANDCCSGVSGSDSCRSSLRSHCNSSVNCVGDSEACNAFNMTEGAGCEAIDCGGGAHCCRIVSGVCSATGAALDCRYSDWEAGGMNEGGDGIYIFTVSFPNVIDPMERWADAASGPVNFSYAGNNVETMFRDILSVIGVRVQVANNSGFNNTGSNWMDETTIPEPDFGIYLDTPNLNDACLNGECADDWQEVYVRTRYGSTGGDDNVTISNPRWQYCPLGAF